MNGSGTVTGDADSLDVHRGQVLAIPAGFGDWSVSGDIQLIACRPGAGWPATLVTDGVVR